MSDGKKLLQWGCLGCLGILGVGIFLAAGSAGLVWREVQKEVPRTETAQAQPSELVRTDQVNDGLILKLDIGHADVYLEPVGDDRELRVEASYDERAYAFEQSRVTTPGGGVVWTITFRRTSRLPFAGLRQLFGGTRSIVRIELPAGLPFSIEGTLGDGALQGALGGTNARSFDVELSRGAVIVGVNEPTVEPMQRFAVETSQGASVISGLGNASPREVSLGCSLGGCVIDLGGEWRNDASIVLDASMSGAVLSLSEDVVHQGLEDVKGFDRYDTPVRADLEIPLPTLSFDVKGKWEIQ